MSNVFIHSSARIRLYEIWDYTFQTWWSEEQADLYVRELHKSINYLCANQSKWRILKDPRFQGVFFYRCGLHFIV